MLTLAAASRMRITLRCRGRTTADVWLYAVMCSHYNALKAHHEGAHHLVVLVHVVVAVQHVLAQVRAIACCYYDLTDVGADVHDLWQDRQSAVGPLVRQLKQQMTTRDGC